MEMFKSIAKNTVVFGMVGLLLALSAPAIAGVVGVLGGEALGASAAKIAASTYANALYEGAFFAMFGALVPPLEKAYTLMFGGDKAKDEAASPEKEKSTAKQINITVVQAPQQTQGQAIVDAKFRQNLDAERVAELLTKDQTLGV